MIEFIKIAKFSEEIKADKAAEYFSYLVGEDISSEDLSMIGSNHIVKYMSATNVKIAPLKINQKAKANMGFDYEKDNIDYKNALTPVDYLIPFIGVGVLGNEIMATVLKDKDNNYYTYILDNEPYYPFIAGIFEENGCYKTRDIARVAKLYNNKEIFYVEPIKEIDINVINRATGEARTITFMSEYDPRVRDDTEQYIIKPSYSNIISALLALLKSKNNSMTQTKTAETLEEKYKETVAGFSKSSLEKEFAECNKRFKAFLDSKKK